MEKTLSIEEIHNVTLDVMDRLHATCEENGISYYLGFGTLIGAVRHKGFIPWDDDFDICMMRKDYNKFCALFDNDNNSRYRLATRKNNHNYIYGIARFYDSEYSFCSDDDINEFELGIFIDVYPMDSCSSDPKVNNRILGKTDKINRDYAIYINKRSTSSRWKNMVRVPYHYFLKLKYGNRFPEIADNKIESIIYNTCDSNTEYVGEYWDGWKDFRILKKEWFAERELCRFEDRMYWIPKGYDDILKRQYGDYMKLPPESERHATHSYSIVKK